MAAGFNIDQVASASIKLAGSISAKSVLSMHFGGKQIWPKISYVITSASVVYSESSAYPGETLSYIAAKGDNYATIIGTVEKHQGSIVVETYTNVTLTPVNSSGTSTFFIVGNQVHGNYLGYTVKSLTSETFGAKYIGEDGIESELYDVTISQQGNQITSTTDTITAIGVGIDITGANFGVTGGTGTLSATKVYSRTYTYTSTYEHTDYGQTANISESTTFTFTGTSGATISGRIMSVSSRVRNAAVGAWVVTGTYTEGGIAYTDTLDVSQTADVKISETMSASNYSVSIGVGTSSISASGGSATLNWGGTYTLTITQIWQSDPDTPYVITQPNIPISGEYISITESGNTSGRFHRSGASVTHDNMTTNKTTDSVTYTASVVIEGETVAHDSVSLSATNDEVSTREVTTGFGLGVGRTSFTVDGGTAALSGIRVYSIYSTLTTGYEILKSSGNTENVTSNTTFSVSGSSGGSISGKTTLTISSRRKNANAGSWIVTGAWSDYTDTESVSQAADTYTDTSSDSNYIVSIGIGTSSISAAGGTATLNWSASHTHTVHRVWSSGETEDFSYSQPDTPTISGSASYFSRSGATVTHDYMGTRETTDSVTYTATNNGVSRSVTLSATNSKGTPTVSQQTLDFGIKASPDSFDAEGGTSILTGREYYAIYYDYTWTSGATSRTTDHRTRSVTTSFSVTPSSGCYLYGNTLEIYTRTVSSSETWTVVGTWNGYTAYATITQEGAIIKEEIYISAEQSGYDIYATASSSVYSSITVTINASSTAIHEETFTVTISSGSRESTHHTLSFEPDEYGISEISPTSDTHANYLIN